MDRQGRGGRRGQDEGRSLGSGGQGGEDGDGWERAGGGRRTVGSGGRGGYDGGGGERRGGRGGGETAAGLGRDFQQMNVGNRVFDQSRGSGGRGGGRGRATTKVTYVKREPKCTLGPNHWDKCQKGWLSSFISSPSEENPEVVNLLPSRKPGDDSEKAMNFTHSISIMLNHFPVGIRFPKLIHQYHIEISRVKNEATSSSSKCKAEMKGRLSEGRGGAGDSGPAQMLPTDLRKQILIYEIGKMQTQYGKSYGIFTDFSATLYSVKRLEEMTSSLERTVRGENFCLEEEEGSRFLIKFIATPVKVDTSNLKIDVNKMKGIPVPVDLVSLERIYSSLMRCVNLNKYTPMRRSDLINFHAEPHHLGGGVVSYSGFNILLPLTNGWKKFINIEISNLAAYLGGPVFDVLQDVFAEERTRIEKDVRKWDSVHFEKANELLRTCKVTYRPEPMKIFTKVVVKVCPKSVSDTKFEYNGRQISVCEYFETAHRRRLAHPHGPLLECKGNNGPKIPAELCRLTKGQSFNRKLNDSQTTKIAEVARKNPGDLQISINRAIEELNLRGNDLFDTYGLKLENEGRMHQVKAKVLTPPELCYGKQLSKQDATMRATIIPEDGVWDIWSHDFEFFEWGNIESWGILNLAAKAYKGPNRQGVITFANELSAKARTKGIVFPKCPSLYREVNLPDSAERRDGNVNILKKELEDFQNALGSKNKTRAMSFVLVIIPKKGCQVYNHVKQAAELEVGILTQCIAGVNMAAGNRLESILGNVLLKINSKLNKVNQVIMAPSNFSGCFKIFNYPVMIMGADVTHPPPGVTKMERDKDGNVVEVTAPSFAAVTGSVDRTGMPYMMHIQAQKKAGKGAAEVITGLDVIVKKFLWAYRARSGHQPVKIIYLRDGVGEGQFQEVLRTEMWAIRRACQDLNKEYQPQITFVTVQKRHKTRFFIPNSNNNAPPGTVVDTDIIHPVEKDFYLLSHKGMLGTSRPTRYHVLWDDSDFSSNEIQTMAYFLCYMFARCNRSVKIPAPTYYAHWAAKRAEVLCKGWGESYYGDINELNRRLGVRDTINKFSQNYPMHFV